MSIINILFPVSLYKFTGKCSCNSNTQRGSVLIIKKKKRAERLFNIFSGGAYVGDNIITAKPQENQKRQPNHRQTTRKPKEKQRWQKSGGKSVNELRTGKQGVTEPKIQRPTGTSTRTTPDPSPCPLATINKK